MNPFDDVKKQVAVLQQQHTELTATTGKLEQQKKGLVEDVHEANRLLTDAKELLEQRQREITEQTNAYNEWQAGQLAELQKAKDDFALTVRETEDGLAKRETDAKEYSAAVERERKSVKEMTVQLKTDQEDIDAQTASNTAWAERLANQERAVKEAEQTNVAQTDVLAGREEQLTVREAKVTEAEKAVETALKTANQERENAHVILESAKDRIAKTDARERAQDAKEVALNNKATELSKKEAALNDRINIMTANGTLPR